MCYRAGHPRKASPPHPGRQGFTLIELLTVVAIIGLLVGMVVPTIRSVIQAQVAVVTKARVGSLSNGVYMYKMSETGNKYFPGQQAWAVERLVAEQTGSYFLAECLFTDWRGYEKDQVLENHFPTGAYGKYEEDMLDDDTGTETGERYSILDGHATPMAVLYFPSRVGGEMKGEAAQYVQNDNLKYLNADTVAANATLELVVQQDDTIVNDGEFLLIAPGRGRTYFDADDIHNW